eukprot:CAMPEP_0197489098 /NCGR_PEP_ID=MMETSP1311-20131121/3962_1 /TAXON_ID=464262 /ORGANISM="Genus nov. species nov., Strain RCC856" /LENGTH=396 /DNA_ID=CAMNT_0043033347 /DNA_START=33 /DNA_END=1226 /DNA_ORIENTATION=+
MADGKKGGAPSTAASNKLTGLTLKPVGAASGSRSMEDCYDMVGQVGEGMYGQVYKMREKAGGKELCALKKVRMDNEKEGFPITAIREIKILADVSRRKDNQNIVRLKEIVTSKANVGNDNKGDIYMVFEYMEHDLAGIRENKQCHFNIDTIKVVVYQIICGLLHCHRSSILHRDLKCSNVLVNARGDVKLADFGLARKTGDKRRLTPKVITLWYRPLELLLGNQEYDTEVDMWSVGCILAELLLEKPLLPGKDEPDQAYRILQMFGIPTEASWPGVSRLKMYKAYTEGKMFKENYLESHMMKYSKHTITPHCMDLLKKLLTLNPKERLDAYNAKMHPFFTKDTQNMGKEQVYKKMKGQLAEALKHVIDSHEYEQRLKRKMEHRHGMPNNKQGKFFM